MITYCVTYYLVTEEAIRKWESVCNPLRREPNWRPERRGLYHQQIDIDKQDKGVSFTS